MTPYRPIHVPQPNASDKNPVSMSFDPRHVVAVKGSTLVMANDRRLKTGSSEADLLRLLAWWRKPGPFDGVVR